MSDAPEHLGPWWGHLHRQPDGTFEATLHDEAKRPALVRAIPVPGSDGRVGSLQITTRYLDTPQPGDPTYREPGVLHDGQRIVDVVRIAKAERGRRR